MKLLFKLNFICRSYRVLWHRYCWDCSYSDTKQVFG